MALQIYNSRIQKKHEFTPIDPACVKIYVCGPTVYGPAHIGNARPAVVFDILVRLLRHLYPRVIYARNITDIDDKINKAAADEGVDISVISARYYDLYQQDMAALHVQPPDIEPFATAHIDDILAMITTLIKAEHAYEAEGHVLFDVTSDADYGSLSRRNLEDMQAGARVEVAPYKRNAHDFVLWKPSDSEQPGWQSPYGYGRPGWHIECSAMIKKHLGNTIDIHGGGMDLQFPHHENECAQSRCTNQKELANVWLHNGMLRLGGEKMSKSLGNIQLLNELLQSYPAETIRLALLQGHYRQAIDFTPTLLAQCTRTLDGLYQILENTKSIETEDSPPPDDFLAALCDDLNTPKALAILHHLSKNIETKEQKSAFLAAAHMLGLLNNKSATDWFAAKAQHIDREKVEALIAENTAARQAKDYARADAIRDQLADMGIDIKITPDGTDWVIRS